MNLFAQVMKVEPGNNEKGGCKLGKMRKWCISSSFKLMRTSKWGLFLPPHKIISCCWYNQFWPRSGFYSSVAPSGKHCNWLVGATISQVQFQQREEEKKGCLCSAWLFAVKESDTNIFALQLMQQKSNVVWLLLGRCFVASKDRSVQPMADWQHAHSWHFQQQCLVCNSKRGHAAERHNTS